MSAIVAHVEALASLRDTGRQGHIHDLSFCDLESGRRGSSADVKGSLQIGRIAVARRGSEVSIAVRASPIRAYARQRNRPKTWRGGSRARLT